MAEEEDYTKLPLKQRLSSKSWKARQHAYQELDATFSKCSVLNIPTDVSMYWGSPDYFAKFITDSNVVAQESAVSALHTLLQTMSQMAESLPESSSLRSQWIPPLVEKGISSSRQGTKSKALECILTLVSFDISIRSTLELMLPFTSNKLPRLVSSLMNAMAKIVECFGFLNVKNDFWGVVLEPLPRLAGHADRNVRSETMNFILEVYKWTGEQFLQDLLLDKLKPIQQKDLEKLFAKYDGTIPPSEQPRLFHWQELQRAAEAAATTAVDKDGDTLMGDAFANGKLGGNGDGADISAPPVDPFDLLPKSSIVKNFPTDFDKQVKSVKWKERVEALQKVYDDLLKPVKRLDPADDYSPYIRTLGQIIAKDANLQAATTAAVSVTHLATTLREGIAQYSHFLLDALLERTKEKKPAISEAVGEALDLLAKYYGVDNCLESTVEFMKHKIPNVRLESTNFLTKMLQKHWRPSTSKLKDEVVFRMLPDIIQVVIKIVNDTQPALRDSGFECFATMMKLFGEREFSDTIEKLGGQKKKKIYEYYEKIEVTAPPITQSVAPAPRTTATHATQPQRANKLTAPSATIPSSSITAQTLGEGRYQENKHAKSHSVSTIPSKRGPTSPLKEKVATRTAINTKSRLVGISPTHSNHKATQLAPPASLISPQSSSHSAVSAAIMSELEDLRAQKTKWTKERQQLMAKLTSFQTQTSQLNAENQMLQDQLNEVQIAFNEKTISLRSKDLQITKLKNRLATLESELDTALNEKHLANTPVKSVIEGIHAISPSRDGSAHGESINENGNQTDPCISIQPHNPDQSRKASGGSFRPNTGLTSRFSPLNSSIRVATSSESSDDLPRRVHSLHIMDTSNAVAGSTTTNGSSASLLSDESWKRAAEVTNQLKARIERMRAKTRGVNNMDVEDI